MKTTTIRGIRRAFPRPALIAAAITLMHGAASAQQPAEPEALAMEPVVVTASRGRARPASELPLSTTVLTREDILNSPGRTLDEVLRAVAGVQLPVLNSTANFPVNPGVALRGVGLGDNGTRTLILLDGVPINGAFFGNVFWNRIPKQNIDRIEIVRGSSSSLFGSLAIGGVISIFTRAPDAATRASASGRGGSDGTLQGDVAISGGITERLAIGISANYLETDGYFLTRERDRAPIDARTKNEISNFSLSANYTTGERFSAHARLDYFDQDQNTGTRLSNNQTNAVHLSGGFEAVLGDTSRLRGALFYSDEEFSNDGTSTVTRGSRDAEFISNTHDTPAESLGGSLQYTRSLSGPITEFTLGADWRRLEGRDDQDIFTSDGALFLNQIADGRQRFVGLFADSALRFTDRAHALVSLRYDDVRIADGRQILNGVAQQLPDSDFDRINARVALGYRLHGSLSLHGVYARAFRAPTLAELYRRFGTSTFVGLPNPDLKPETSTSGELGLRFEQNRFRSELNLYQINIKDQIGGVVVGFGPFTLRNENVGEARSRGLEWINSIRLSPSLELDASYIHLDTEILRNPDDPELIGNRLEGAPDNSALFGLRWSPGQWNLTLRARWLDQQFQDASNETRIPSHWVVDASARYWIKPELEAFISVENLLDRTYTASAFGGLERRGAPLQALLGLAWRPR